ncbi:MAG: L-fucose:H+ symporter permease [Chitinophagaceae bacterium]
MTKSNNYLLPFILITSLFFLWAFLHNINPILIPHLKKACQLTDTQSAFIDTSVYLGYFTMALPAGWFMHKYGYKKAVLFGLFLFAAGFLLFIPAANIRDYSFFLVALFISAAGATFLETVANPYVTKLGDEKTAAVRINFAQSFNGVGAFLAPIIGGQVILSGIEHSKEELANMDSASLTNYLNQEASTVKIPYLIIGLVVLMIMCLFYITRIPEIKEKDEKATGSFSLKVFRHAQLSWAVVAQFFYVGAQVCVGSFFVRFVKYVNDVPEKAAATYVSIAMVGFMAGRFTGTLFMKYIKPAKLLGIYALINMALIAAAILLKGNASMYALIAVPFFMSIMFPTIFAMGISGLGEETKIASSFIVMAIAGGAVFPLLMGAISDATGGNIQLAYIIPIGCFAVVAFFAFKFRNLFTGTAATH